MKIMMIAPGRSIHSNNWASAMCDRGHEVHFVTQESFTNNKYSFNDTVDERFIVHQLPIKGKIGFFLNGPFVKKLYKSINPDIVHVHQAAGYGLLGTFTSKKNALVSVYGWEIYDRANNFLWKPIIRYIFTWYRYIGSTSKCMKEQIYKVFPDLNKNVVVTPFGVNMQKFYYSEVDKDELIIGTVKKMDVKYGIDYLIKAFSKTYNDLNISNPEIASKLYLELVGPGNQIDELKSISKQLGIDSRVRFIGRVPHTEVVNWLNRFDIYSAPSILDSESFGVAVIEASACRVPVVVSDVGGLPEVVEDGVTGYVVRAKNEDELSLRLTELAVNKEKRLEMGLNGEKSVKTKYEWSECVSLMERVYQSIINRTYDSIE